MPAKHAQVGDPGGQVTRLPTHIVTKQRLCALLTWTALSPHLNKWMPTLTVVAIIWLGFGLRLFRLGEQNIWWDEGHAIWAARQSLRRTTEITATDVHPPLYLWMLHGWLQVAGESEFAVRFLSLAGGTLTVALCYVVARRLIRRPAALLATGLLAGARFHIWWSQEARMYVWATLFALLSTDYLVQIWRGRQRAWWLYMLASAAALYTLYLAVLVLFVHNAFVALTIWRRPRRLRFLARWCLAQAGMALLYLPWLAYAASRARTDTAKTPFPFYQIWQLYGTVLATGHSTELDRYVWLLVAFGLLAVTGIVLLLLDRTPRRQNDLTARQVALLLALPLVLPPLVIYGLSIPRGVYYSPKPEARYLLVLSPFFYILLASTIVYLWRDGRLGRVLATLSAVGVLATFIAVLPIHYNGRYLRDEYQSATATLAAYALSSALSARGRAARVFAAGP